MSLVLLILSLGLNVILGWVTFNLLRKVETFEEYFNSLHIQLQHVLNQITSIDIRGAFEADDEVGIVFKGIKGMIETLNDFLVKGNDNTE